MDRNRFLLDQKTYSSFGGLNKKILDDLDLLAKSGLTGDQLNLTCKNIGRSSVTEIQKLTESFVDAARQYIKKTYSVDVEKVV